jgi:hypothetical protein
MGYFAPAKMARSKKNPLQKRPMIASTSMEAIYRNGDRKRITLGFSAPWKSGGSWWVLPKITGLGEDCGPIAGDDSMQAMTLAIKYMIWRVESLQKRMRFRLVWPGTDQKLNLRESIMNPGPHPRSKT